ncbi:hypothetical protein ANOM_001132 [Aspergillus nomiae NRRL 13137]|uniref:Uncharacterized protein n=1 Tax=Aspergillus nomiae NRRL (strain ATCC 15546 / NRRL 13137 / CBS 260.88 / M93) TaxID=1509407 RepID=A0A0L1JGZ6_ASPN3|nr:uncharacterized protein ANOM_001132 [Aspergillus nomiae NRRL 13137]KNG90673.1 hypothetical protein ANOM_001132 [Aspergillus nomiae NRRL 13137]
MYTTRTPYSRRSRTHSPAKSHQPAIIPTPRNKDEFYIQRPEQPLIDDILRGTETGHYWLIVGERGTGKTSMLVHSMRDIYGRDVVMLDVHDDIDVFQVRLGKALVKI